MSKAAKKKATKSNVAKGNAAKGNAAKGNAAKGKTKEGIVYLLTNEKMQGLVKIGKTGKTAEALTKRVKELSRPSGVPVPFTVFYAVLVKDATFVERQLHNAFGDHRIKRKEFFSISPNRVEAAMMIAQIKDMTPKDDIVNTPQDKMALDWERGKRPWFDFDMVNIKAGSKIYFSRDGRIKATVVNPRTVRFRGKETSVSAAAQKILGINYGVSGTEHWMYDGETLDERRKRISSEKQ